MKKEKTINDFKIGKYYTDGYFSIKIMKKTWVMKGREGVLKLDYLIISQDIKRSSYIMARPDDPQGDWREMSRLEGMLLFWE